jgi:hypothetical protein
MYTYEDYNRMQAGLKMPTTDELLVETLGKNKPKDIPRIMDVAVPVFLTHYFNKSKIIRSDDVAEHKKIWDATVPIAKRKLTEHEYKKDSKNLRARYFIGFIMERAIEKHYGLPPFSFCDITAGHNVDKNLPDMLKIGINVGIKGCQRNFFPLIPPNCGYANIVCLIDGWGLDDENMILNRFRDVAILGLATPENIRKHTTDAFVWNQDAKRGDNGKSGFYGFDYLEPLPPLDELRKRFPWDGIHA